MLNENPLWIDLLLGPVGGFLTSAVGFFVFEMWFRRRRERRDLAWALAAELEVAADRIATLSKDPTPGEIPGWFTVPIPVFSAVPARLGELPYEAVKKLSEHYGNLEQISRMGPEWRSQAVQAMSIPGLGRIERQAELTSGADDFYALLPGLETDCRNVSAALRQDHRTLSQRLFRRRV